MFYAVYLKQFVVRYRFTTYQDARRVRLVDGLEYLKQIFYEYHPLRCVTVSRRAFNNASRSDRSRR